MSKYQNSKENNNNPCQTSSCFNTIFQKLICSGNLPKNPSLLDHKLEKPAKIHPFTRPVTYINDPDDIKAHAHKVQVQAQAHGSPGIIGRLMGLESLPNAHNNEMLFRSKSMNSLQFLPDFDPIRAAFHRRARTSASFHEQGHNKFLLKIDENMEYDDMKQRKKENEVVLKEDECKKCRQNSTSSGRTKDSGISSKNKSYYDECFTTSKRSNKLKNRVDEKNGGISKSSNCSSREKSVKQERKLIVKNNKDKFDGVGSTTSLSKKKVDHKQEMCSSEFNIIQSDDLVLLPSRSPVSVFELHQELSPTSKGEGRQETSNATRKSSPKTKLFDHLTQDIVPKTKQHNNQDYSNKDKVVKEEEDHQVVKEADSSLEMVGHIFKLADEDHIKDSKWVAYYDVFKVQFVEDLCVDLGHELLDLLLDELVDMVIMSF